MEEIQVLPVVIIVFIIQLSDAEILNNGAIGCSLVENLCRYDEFCNEGERYPYGKCKKLNFRKTSGHITSKRNEHHRNGAGQNGNADQNDWLDNTKYDMTYFRGDGSARIISSSERAKEIFRDDFLRNNDKEMRENSASLSDTPNGLFENGKYDMTHFSESDVDALSHEYRSSKVNRDKNKESLSRNLDWRGGELEEDRPNEDIIHNLEKKITAEYGDGTGGVWPPIAIPLKIPDNEQREVKHRKQTRNLQPIETRDSKSSNEERDMKRNTHSKNDESLDLDIEMKPLTESDSKYFDENKSKLSSIPKTPSKESTQKIEHVQTNIVSESASKKTKVGVLVGGKLDQTKAEIVQNNSEDPTYDKVKDFFKSQQVSSIVDAPSAEKKGVKLYNIPHGKETQENVKRSSIPQPVVHPDRIRLDLKERLNPDKASDLLGALQDLLWGDEDGRQDVFTSVATDEKTVLFHLLNNTTSNGVKPAHVVQRINKDKSVKDGLKKAVGVTVLAASLDSKGGEKTKKDDDNDDHKFMVTTLIVAGCVSGILLASVCIFIILRRTSKDYPRWVPKQPGYEAASDYQSLWRQLKQATWESPIQTTSVAHSDDGAQKDTPANKGVPPKYSWSEEPVDTKMDISTGHVVLAYMEDHLKNENRLSKEWEDLSVYEAEPDSTDVGKDPKNSKKNRYSDVLPYDHNRVKLRDTSNATGSDYINASYIIDDDPRNPAYIATQGPLASTVADFWQMVWEQGVVIIVMLTKLADLGLPQCHRYWPQKGPEVYHIYQVHLISEHIWCSDYLVRSFYLKNVQTDETRTVTQFHYLTWPHLGIPFSSKPLLDFRRKVLKCFRSQSCPVVVHCSGGIDRTGTYILIDMVLSKMSRGTKEIDIAATLEHLRDQRPQMVKTKSQFEFALASVAEEVNAILQVLTKH
ncbi:receptor-type tyrosine-protein phosphatase N2-like [Dendronephthya gigantea]|uniref:receptor-type tyrosine-protein phosphatase N2-like n=1 Tax=Dendronephthya gigantea TaxID=151771 RepID=UPI00106B25E9|nr:receptor-type tyrosine-protein phosphatase N2-like [Dendronephthya gigantea]